MEKICKTCNKKFNGKKSKQLYCSTNCSYKTGRRLGKSKFGIQKTLSNGIQNKIWMRDYRMRSRYGITLNDYNQIFLQQKGFCKICNKHQSEMEKSLSVDHDHSTGKIRGLLCHNCNLALGYFNDNISLLEKAISYLKN